MSRRPVTVIFLLLAAPVPARRISAQQPNASAKTELVVGREDFQKLRWIVGSWRGEGEGQPAFYERYRFVDDSTLVSERFSDSRFRALKESTRFELRDHRVKTRGGSAPWIATGLDSVSAGFRAVSGATNNVVWQRHDANEWTAVLTWPPTVDHPARAVTYHMKRVKGN